MPVPQHVFDPPFNIVRSSHAVLDVTDLNASREFYENTVGLHVEDRDDKSVYLRGSEEHQHHSLVLRKAPVAACSRLGFKVGNDGDLDKAASFFSENGITYAFAEQPFQGRVGRPLLGNRPDARGEVNRSVGGFAQTVDRIG